MTRPQNKRKIKGTLIGLFQAVENIWTPHKQAAACPVELGVSRYRDNHIVSWGTNRNSRVLPDSGIRSPGCQKQAALEDSLEPHELTWLKE